ncbi:hypothetical protein Patl1_27169 [Pistacia atlantica]|uniref:Uncharacterized protein n=1 Tax=Pistacia atlantica TaxID=434234 RepID=A0ACC1B3Z3_9ROSI|nr:hypothetical protein Patl1_27169 [Pistacia atlantica]
MNPKIYDFGIG